MAESIHSRDRLIRVKHAAIWSIAAKCASLLVSMISVPFAISTLGDDGFGIWISITTFFGLFGFLDGGIGNSVINLVADQRVAKNEKQLQRIISTSYLMLFLVGVFGAILGIAGTLVIDWKYAISLPDEIEVFDVKIAALIVGILFFANLPLSLSARIRQGMQESHYNSMFEFLSYFLTLLGTFLAWRFHASLYWFVFAFAIGPILANVTNTALLFMRKEFCLRPSFGGVSKGVAKQILGTGALFLGLQFCAALAFQTDTIIVSHIVGLSGAAELGLVMRMFFLASTVAGFFIAPLWPAFRDAAVRQEMDWVVSVFKRSLRNSLIISLSITLPLLLAHKPLIALWSNNQVQPSFALVFGVFLWTNLSVVGNLLAVLLNSLQVVRIQLLLAFVMAPVNIGLSVFFTHQFGVSGVVYGTLVSYVACILIPYSLLLPSIFKRYANPSPQLSPQALTKPGDATVLQTS